jgi:hypothetical protein
VIKIDDAKGKREVFNQMYRGEDTVHVGVNYYGSGTAEVLLDGDSYKTFSL